MNFDIPAPAGPVGTEEKPKIAGELLHDVIHKRGVVLGLVALIGCNELTDQGTKVSLFLTIDTFQNSMNDLPDLIIQLFTWQLALGELVFSKADQGQRVLFLNG